MNLTHRLLATAVVAASLAAPAFAAENSYPADTTAPRAVVGPSLHQWKALASVEADALAQKLGPNTGPWQLKLSDGADSRFGETFNKMLISELAARGVQLSTRASDSVIELKVDTLRHFYDKRSYQPGSLTAVAAGVWLVKGLTDIASPGVVATVLTVGADVAATLARNTKDAAAGEFALTLVAEKDGLVKASTTNVYLVNYQATGVYLDQPGRTLQFIK
jgi:hypothetical protein